MADGGEPPVMRWWGWGDPQHRSPLPAGALELLAESIGAIELSRPPVALREVALEPCTLSASELDSFRAILGADGVRADHRERVLHAAGKGYPDLVRLRDGRPEGSPDAVLLPHSSEQVQAVLELCARSSLAVVPFGGGTSVVGGLAPLRGRHRAVLVLDTRRMRGILGLDRESRTVTVEGGLRAPALERYLAGCGLTLGHFPQSFEYVSLGGCAATRSAGQASSGYGAIDRMVRGVRLCAPAGELRLPALPASAAGPQLRELIVGSEGALGVISELSLRVRAAPQQRVYEGVFFDRFESGATVLRTLAQRGASPTVARLSDRQETRMSLALAGSRGLKGRLERLYLDARGYREGCLAILGFEGSPEEVALRRREALALARSGGGMSVGRSPGEAWLKGRFAGPYMRDELLTQGVMVETLETATQWSNLLALHRTLGSAIGDALRGCGTPALVMCHISHLYETGASLYFTIIARRRAEDELGQWRALKDAAGRAIIEGGGTITHHHAIGRDHASFLPAEIGAGGVAALYALKSELDPVGIMNPGKLLEC